MTLAQTYPYIQSGSHEHSRGFYLEKKDLDLISSGSLLNYPFGKFDNEVLEFSVYSSEKNLLYWNVIKPEQNYTPISRSYIDITNQNVSYNYKLFNGTFICLDGDRQKNGANPIELVVSPVDDIKNAGLPDGIYTIVYSPVKNQIGTENPDQQLIIKDISPSRTELTVIPHCLKTSNQPNHIKLNDEFYRFFYSQVKSKYVVDDIVNKIKVPDIVNIFFSTAKSEVDVFDRIKFLYAFQNDITVLNFIIALYKEIASLLEHWLFSIYEDNVSFTAIKNYYNDISFQIIDRELKKISQTEPTDYIDIISFFQTIFNSVFVLSIEDIQSQYRTRNGNYLKNYLNFGSNKMFPILNWTVTGENINDDNFHSPLYIKLLNPLPRDYKEKDRVWISNLAAAPSCIQNVVLFKPTIIETKKLGGPNFFISTEENLQTTKEYSFDSLTSGSCDTTSQKTLNYFTENHLDKKINIDYTKFENFIHFSSAQTRLELFKVKLNQIQQLEVSSSVIPDTDIFFMADKTDMQDEINELKNSFDGYESFLYKDYYSNSTEKWIDIHGAQVGDGLNTYTSASLYDRFNDDSLFNNTPEFINSNEYNQDYLTFLNMIGHHFDIIYSYIDHLPTTERTEENPNEGISNDIVNSMLSSLGWKVENGNGNAELLLSLFGEDKDGNTIEAMSGKERTATIWRRILTNLPYILKSKGTEESIKALLSCYGIPKCLFKIREFGGIEYNTDQDASSLFIFDNCKYALEFRGACEYLRIPWVSTVRTLEFKLGFNVKRTYEAGKIYRIINCEDKWVIGVIRDNDDQPWGRVFFTISGDNSYDIKSTITPRIPIFNGELFTIMLRKNDVDKFFDIYALKPGQEPDCDTLLATASDYELDQVPTQYDLVVKRAEDERFIFNQSASLVLSGSYNTVFRSEGTSSYINIGNYSQSVSSPLGFDPEAFHGYVDQIRFWKNPLEDSRFDNHVQFSEAYDSSNPLTTVENLILKVDFDLPTDLHSASWVPIPNSSYNKTYITQISASNFPFVGQVINHAPDFEEGCIGPVDLYVPGPCDSPVTGDRCQEIIPAVFPYQFAIFETRETVNLPNFGSQKFRSNKIRKESQDLTSNLSSQTRSTVPSSFRNSIDSNKLGVFFSPVDLIDNDIIRFFGYFHLGDLIGDPMDLFSPNYEAFEDFKKVYFDNGGGQVNFESYINAVKAYFDKSLFTSIESLVPARCKVISGLLIEPTLLERPKIKYKPIEHKIHNNIAWQTNISYTPKAEKIPLIDTNIEMGHGNGIAVYNNFFKNTFQNIDEGYSVYTDKRGLFYKNNDVFKVEIIKKKESKQTFNNKVMPLRFCNSNDLVNYDFNQGGLYSTTTASFDRVNFVKLPTNLASSSYETYTTSSYMSFQGIFSGSLGVTFSSNFTSSNYYTGSTRYNSAYPLYITSTGSILDSDQTTVIHYFQISSSVNGHFDGNFAGNFSGSYFEGIVTGSFIGSVTRSIIRREVDYILSKNPFENPPLIGYHYNHYKFKRKFFGKSSIQSNETTIDPDSLIEDGSEVVVITKVDRGIINTGAQGNGFILNVNG